MVKHCEAIRHPPPCEDVPTCYCTLERMRSDDHGHS